MTLVTLSIIIQIPSTKKDKMRLAKEEKKRKEKKRKEKKREKVCYYR